MLPPYTRKGILSKAPCKGSLAYEEGLLNYCHLYTKRSRFQKSPLACEGSVLIVATLYERTLFKYIGWQRWEDSLTCTLYERSLCLSPLIVATATHCNTLQHTATHCNTMQHAASHCNTLPHTVRQSTHIHKAIHKEASCTEEPWKRAPQENKCVAVCWSVLQCQKKPLVLESLERKRHSGRYVLQCVAVCCSVLQCVAVGCSVLQWAAVCCSAKKRHISTRVCCSVLRCTAVCCSVLQCVAVCCSVLQCQKRAHARTRVRKPPWGCSDWVE